MSRSPHSPAALVTAQKRADSLRLRIAGFTFEQIAEAVGWAGGRSAARKAVVAAAAEEAVKPEEVDHYRTLSTMRMLDLIRRATEIAARPHYTFYKGKVVQMAGPDGIERPALDPAPNLTAIRTIVSIEERLAALLGLDAAQKFTVGGDGTPIPVDLRVQVMERAAELRARLPGQVIALPMPALPDGDDD